MSSFGAITIAPYRAHSPITQVNRAAHFPSAAATGIGPKTDQSGRLFVPQASSRPDRFLTRCQGEAEGLQGGACFLWFISLHEQRKNLPPGNPGLDIRILGQPKMSDCRIGNTLNRIVPNN